MAVKKLQGRVAQIQKHEKDCADRNEAFENSSNIAGFQLLRLVGGPTQPRSGIWATRPQDSTSKLQRSTKRQGSENLQHQPSVAGDGNGNLRLKYWRRVSSTEGRSHWF